METTRDTANHRHGRALAALVAIARYATMAACILTVAGLPGSVTRAVGDGVASAPLLPLSTGGGLRDAALRVTALATGTHAAVAAVHVDVITMVERRAYIAGQGRTDAAGTVVLTGLPRGEAWVLATATSFARASRQLILEGTAREIEVELAPERTLDVRIADDRGAPFANAEVEVTGADPLAVGARTASDGHASVGRLGEPPWIVTARAPGFESVTQRGVHEGPVTLVLRKLGAFVITVADGQGVPVAGAHVQIASTALWPPRVAETDAGGRVRIGALAAGSYALRATHASDASPIELGLTLDRGEEKAATLVVHKGVVVSAWVTDGEGERANAVPGAKVSLAEGGLSPFPLEGVTDRKGRVLLGPVTEGPATATARADGFVSTSRMLDVGKTTEVRLAIVRAGTLTGRVVDGRGRPVGGASLEIVGTAFSGAPIDDDSRRTRFTDAHFDAVLVGPRPLVAAGELGVVPGPVPPIPRAFDHPGRTADAPPGDPWVTRQDGSFHLTPVSPGRVRALVRHPEFVEAMSDVVTLLPGGTASVDVILHAGGGLEGRVVETEGRPVPGARVVVSSVHGSLERSTRTSSDGSFAFASLPDLVSVSVFRHDDAANAATRVTLAISEGRTDSVTLTLPAPRDGLPIRVHDDRGYPLDAVQVAVLSLDPSAPLRTTVFTNARGEATVPNARGIALRIEARAPGHATKIVTADASATSIDVELGPSLRANGVVRADRSSTPIPDAEVILYADPRAHRARTDKEGAYTFSDVAKGPARIEVRAEGFALYTREVSIDANARDALTLPPVDLAAEAVVTGLVVDEHGDPVAGARVAQDQVPTYIALGSTPAGMAFTDADGRFRLRGLGEGTLTLEAFSPDAGRARVHGIHVATGRTTADVRIALGGGHRGAEPTASGSVAVTLGQTGGEPPEVVVVAVAGGSEAERAGLLPTDAILAVDGRPVKSIEEARARLSGPLADDVVLDIRRNGRKDVLRVAREAVRR